jgi:ubiquinone/menaquinone biosynthesis C-methylase UbiE
VPPPSTRGEGLSERLEIADADARNLPFPSGSFDVVLSSLAYNNISLWLVAATKLTVSTH